MKSNRLNKLIGLAGLALCLCGSASALRAEDEQDPNEIKDTLLRAKAKGILVACADPYNYPYSAKDADPAGFDVEIFRAIAKRAGLRAEMFWTDTGTRGGLGRAFRQSIFAKRCDIFLGLSDSGDDDQLQKKLVFTSPYMSMGYVLVVQGAADKMKSVDELIAAKVKIGVSMSTPMDDYLFMNNIPRGLYMGSRRALEGMYKGEVDAAMVWSSSVAENQQHFPDAKFHLVDGYVPMKGQRFNSRYAVRKEDESLLKFVNEAIEDLVAKGAVQKMVGSYSVPFLPPL